MADIQQKELTVALASTLSCLISQLSKAGVIDAAELVTAMQETAAAHRAKGNSAQADAIFSLSEYLLSSVPAGSSQQANHLRPPE